MAWDGESLWVYKPYDPTTRSGEEASRLIQLSPSGKEIQRVHLSRNLTQQKALTYYHGHFWMLDYANTLYQLSRTGEIVSELKLSGLAGDDKAEKVVWHQDQLWILEKNYPGRDGAEIPPKFSRIDPVSGAVLESFEVNYPGFEAMFENLVSDGHFLYLAKSHLYSKESNLLFRVDLTTRTIESTPLKRIYTGISTLFFAQGQMYGVEVLDVVGCNKGCRGILHAFSFDNMPLTERPPINMTGGSPSEAGGKNPQSAPTADFDKVPVGDYVMPVASAFGIQSLSQPVPPAVESEKKQLLADFKSGLLNPYYRVPAFSVLMANPVQDSHLAAGSEGSALTGSVQSPLSAGSEGSAASSEDERKLAAGSEGSAVVFSGEQQIALSTQGSYFSLADRLNQVPPAEASFARAVVLEANRPAKVYQGQFKLGRFYFPGLVDIAAGNTTYLLALNADLKVEIFVGRLQANPGIQNDFELHHFKSPAVSPEAAQQFEAALKRHDTPDQAYLEILDKIHFSDSSGLPPMYRSIVLLRLIEAFPEVAADINEIIGLSSILSDDRIRALQERYKVKYPTFFADAPADDPFVHPFKRGSFLESGETQRRDRNSEP